MKISSDVVIIGGGIAGLYTLALFRTRGVEATLLEVDRLGGGQTIAAQGIIHSGIKYSLNYAQPEQGEALRCLPSLWTRLVNGEGEVNLSGTEILSQKIQLWIRKGARINSTALLQGYDLCQIPLRNLPNSFRNSQWIEDAFEANEPVISIPSLIHSLSSQCRQWIRKIEPSGAIAVKRAADGKVSSLHIGSNIIAGQLIIFTCGEGNGLFLNAILSKAVSPFLRPLAMVVFSVSAPISLYGHYIDGGATPRITITSHVNNGKYILYLGGKLAEQGAAMNDQDLISLSQEWLSEILPSTIFNNRDFNIYRINRAEGICKLNDQRREPVILPNNNAFFAWPVKLSYVPLMAERLWQVGICAAPGSFRKNGLISFADNSDNVLCAQPPWEV